jgi:hypothetical protein
MTSKKDWPVPLRKRDIGLGEAVREYARKTEATPAQAAAYARVLEGMAGRPRRTPWVLAGLGVGAMAALVLFALGRGASPTVPQVALPQASPKPAPSLPVPAPAPPTPITSVPSLRLAAEPSVLPAGKLDLIEQATVVLSADAVARGHSQAGHTEIALDKGSIELHVRPRAPGQDFAVSAGGYRFMVVGTAFTVSQNEARLELAVSEGKVAVWRGAERLTTIAAGGHWAAALGSVAVARSHGSRMQVEAAPATTSRERIPAAASILQPPPAPSVSPKDSPVIVAPALAPMPKNVEPAPQPTAKIGRGCIVLAGQPPQEAMGCYQQQAAQGGLAGEAALYEIARLWRDAFHDSARALAAFREQKSRFPRGVLSIEADLSIIELLPRLDRHAEALVESERYLKEHPAGERRSEIHLLRGNIYREAMRDFERAEREYAEGAESRGRTGDESRFLRAVCLETMGRTQEARRAYESYLSQPKSVHAAEAKKRLERLSP